MWFSAGVRLAAALALAASVSETNAAACATALDCSLNGDCSNGACVCDSGWTGDKCGVIALLPSVANESYVAPNHTSSWGMSIVTDPATGAFHGFVSEFANGCKLGSWTTNSYVNHVVASTPTGPWRQTGVALPAWTHNPKVVFDPKEKVWVMFHIGQGKPNGPLQNCTSSADSTGSNAGKGSPAQRNNEAAATSEASADGGNRASRHNPRRANAPLSPPSTAPFAVHFSASLSGPWQPASAALGTGAGASSSPPLLSARARRGVGSGAPGPSMMTLYPGVSNVDAPGSAPPPPGGVRLHEQPAHGNGTVLVAFAEFVPAAAGTLAWDACGGATFDNGHPIEQPNVGSRVGSFEVVGPAFVLAGNPCAIEWPSPTHLYGPFDAASGVVPVRFETNYFELAPPAEPGYRVAGSTQDADGCRGACETAPGCQSFTWDARGVVKPGQGGTCYLRNDTLWWPNVTDGDPARVASGRPWAFDGDNPTVVIDQATGGVTALYRTDTAVGVGSRPLASLIGLATAPSWRGPYSPAGLWGGSLTNQQYPYDENEDPFIWRSKRGFHALFHANTWGDSRGKVFPVPSHAGRLAYSADGVEWTYAETPPFNGTVVYANGTVAPFARVERPVLVLDAGGNPTHLVNGVQRYAGDDYTFTLVRRVGR